MYSYISIASHSYTYINFKKWTLFLFVCVCVHYCICKCVHVPEDGMRYYSNGVIGIVSGYEMLNMALGTNYSLFDSWATSLL